VSNALDSLTQQADPGFLKERGRPWQAQNASL